MSKRINITLPDQTLTVLDRVSSKGTRSRFIDRAVRRYVESQSKANLREQPKTGYQANADRDLAMAAEWLPLEEEAGQIDNHDTPSPGGDIHRGFRPEPRSRGPEDAASRSHPERCREPPYFRHDHGGDHAEGVTNAVPGGSRRRSPAKGMVLTTLREICLCTTGFNRPRSIRWS
jgi:hypothetical protein